MARGAFVSRQRPNFELSNNSDPDRGRPMRADVEIVRLRIDAPAIPSSINASTSSGRSRGRPSCGWRGGQPRIRHDFIEIAGRRIDRIDASGLTLKAVRREPNGPPDSAVVPPHVAPSRRPPAPTRCAPQ